MSADLVNRRNIQWFPGHMAKTLRLIEADLKNVDAVLQLLDARIPLSSLNPELQRITAAKPRLYVLNKADLADPDLTRAWQAYFHAAGAGCVAISARQKGSAGQVRSAIEAELRELLEKIFLSYGPSHSSEARTQAGLLCFLAALMDEFGSAALPAHSGYDYVKKSIQFIDYNYFRDDIDVGDIAAHAGISRSHLYRLFVQHTAMTPSEYLTRYRIDRAATLLKCNGLSVGEAAYSTGFSDQLYFSRVFKKWKGLPPSQWAARERAAARGGPEGKGRPGSP